MCFLPGVAAAPLLSYYAMDKVINNAIDTALREMKKKQIKGKDSTPFLLAKVSEITGGDSLASNIQLVYNNAALAAKTATVYCDL